MISTLKSEKKELEKMVKKLKKQIAKLEKRNDDTIKKYEKKSADDRRKYEHKQDECEKLRNIIDELKKGSTISLAPSSFFPASLSPLRRSGRLEPRHGTSQGP